MTKTTEKLEIKSMESPDEVREFPNGKIDIVRTAGRTIGRAVFQPGWRWSKDVQPLAKTKSCEAPHFQYQLSGTLRIAMEDGTEMTTKPGDVVFVPPGHDAWVVGHDPVVVIDFQGATDYARAKP